jgi:hypothetical protein
MLLLLLLLQTASKFIVNFVTVVPFFKVTEEVPLNGGSVQQRRRDLRQGRQTAAARTVSSPEQQGVLVEMGWGAPLQGEIYCTFFGFFVLSGSRLCAVDAVKVTLVAYFWKSALLSGRECLWRRAG